MHLKFSVAQIVAELGLLYAVISPGKQTTSICEIAVGVDYDLCNAEGQMMLQ